MQGMLSLHMAPGRASRIAKGTALARSQVSFSGTKLRHKELERAMSHP